MLKKLELYVSILVQLLSDFTCNWHSRERWEKLEQKVHVKVEQNYWIHYLTLLQKPEWNSQQIHPKLFYSIEKHNMDHLKIKS